LPQAKSSILRACASRTKAHFRRLIYEDGEWHCSLSKQRALPAGLDETAEAGHEILPLAILIAFIEALRQSLASIEPRSRTVPPVRPAQGYPVCCDNFA
jgi:hypothetical protein